MNILLSLTLMMLFCPFISDPCMPYLTFEQEINKLLPKDLPWETLYKNRVPFNDINRFDLPATEFFLIVYESHLTEALKNINLFKRISTEAPANILMTRFVLCWSMEGQYGLVVRNKGPAIVEEKSQSGDYFQATTSQRIQLFS